MELGFWDLKFVGCIIIILSLKHSQTKKKVSDLKSSLVDKIQESVDQYSHLYVYTFDNMRSSMFKSVRREWEDSRCIVVRSIGFCDET